MGKQVERDPLPALLATSQFVHTEVILRASKLITGLLSLPYGLTENQSVQQVGSTRKEQFFNSYDKL
jgi:hypothetical protein